MEDGNVPKIQRSELRATQLLSEKRHVQGHLTEELLSGIGLSSRIGIASI